MDETAISFTTFIADDFQFLLLCHKEHRVSSVLVRRIPIDTTQQLCDFTHVYAIHDALRHLQSTVATIEIDLEKSGAK